MVPAVQFGREACRWSLQVVSLVERPAGGPCTSCSICTCGPCRVFRQDSPRPHCRGEWCSCILISVIFFLLNGLPYMYLPFLRTHLSLPRKIFQTKKIFRVPTPAVGIVPTLPTHAVRVEENQELSILLLVVVVVLRVDEDLVLKCLSGSWR